MSKAMSTCPAPRQKVIDLYFLEHRAKIIDIAAFLDRVDRAEDDGSNVDDQRLTALRRAVQLLLEEKPGRAKRVQELFSDMSDEPIDTAPMQGATGVAPNRDYTSR